MSVGIEGGGGALHQIVGLAVLAVDLHGDVLEIDAGGVLHLLHALGVDIGADAAGLEIGVAKLPVLRGGAQVRGRAAAGVGGALRARISF